MVAAAPFACRPCSRRRDCVLRQVKPKYQPKVEDWMQEHMRLDGMRSGFQLFQHDSCEVPVLKDRCDSYKLLGYSGVQACAWRLGALASKCEDGVRDENREGKTDRQREATEQERLRRRGE